MKAVGIIPARYHSTRLPGKPLQPLAGKPLIQHVFENAARSQRLDTIIVATDDERVQSAVQRFGGEVVLTPSALASGTDRCAFVAKTLEADIVANIQGDEPFLDIQALDWGLKLLMDQPQLKVITAARVGLSDDDLDNPHVVKLILDKNQDALYFSRRNIPYIRNPQALSAHPALQHIGVYIFRRDYLLKFVELPPSRLEQLEQLEQLRILENGDRIRVVLTEKNSLGIDTDDDLKKAERILQQNES